MLKTSLPTSFKINASHWPKLIGLATIVSFCVITDFISDGKISLDVHERSTLRLSGNSKGILLKNTLNSGISSSPSIITSPVLFFDR